MNFSFNKNVAIIGFGIAFGLILAYILFSMFFADIPESVPAIKTTGIEAILPHGTNLNLEPIQSYGTRTNRVSPTFLEPGQIGVDSLSQLIKPN